MVYTLVPLMSKSGVKTERLPKTARTQLKQKIIRTVNILFPDRCTMTTLQKSDVKTPYWLANN